MKKYLLIFGFIVLYYSGLSQTDKYPFRKLSIEPAIGLRLSSAFGLVDIQVSALVQYNLRKRLNLVSHSAVSFDINSFKAFKNIKVNHSITKFQKFGIGTSAFTKNTSHTLFLMMGFKDFYYSASIDNPKLEDNVSTKFNTFSLDKGIMYNLKIGKNDRYFSGRIYLPVFDGKWNAIENTSFEFGAGFKMK
jgi:hypothetical protein